MAFCQVDRPKTRSVHVLLLLIDCELETNQELRPAHGDTNSILAFVKKPAMISHDIGKLCLSGSALGEPWKHV